MLGAPATAGGAGDAVAPRKRPTSKSWKRSCTPTALTARPSSTGWNVSAALPPFPTPSAPKTKKPLPGGNNHEALLRGQCPPPDPGGRPRQHQNQHQERGGQEGA